MPLSFYLTNITSDLSGGLYNYSLSKDIGNISTLNLSVANGVTNGYMYGFSATGDLDSYNWTSGDIIVKLNVTTANRNVGLKISVSRVSASGVVLSESIMTAQQTLSSTGTYTFTVVTGGGLGIANPGDRLRVNYILSNLSMGGQSFSIQVGNAGCQITTPFSAVTYQLKIENYGSGTTVPAFGIYPYTKGEIVNLSATPTAGNRFVRWNIDGVDVFTRNTSVTMNAHTLAKAYFEPITTYTLSISIGSGNGLVTPTAGNHTYYEGDNVNLYAMPSEGNRFVKWVINGVESESIDDSIWITMTTNTIAVAYFVQQYTLDIQKNGNGSIIPDVGPYVYDSGSNVNLSAIPDAGYRFVKWVINDVDVFNISTTVTLNSNTVAVAHFMAQYDLNISKVGEGNTTPSIGNHTYDVDSVVNLSATPAQGYRFVKWNIDGVDVFNSDTSVNIKSSKTAIAYFEQIPIYSLRVAVSAGQGYTIPAADGTNYYEEGSVVTLQIFPDTGYYLGICQIGSNNYTTPEINITMDGNKVAYVYFSKYFNLNVGVVGAGSVLPNVGLHYYKYNNIVDLTATPSPGHRFVKWVIDGSDILTPNTSVTITSDVNVIAYFEPSERTLTIQVVGGNGTVLPDIGSHIYMPGSVVNLSAFPDDGYRFYKWVIDGIDNLNANVSVTLNSNTTAVAYFIAQYNLNVYKIGEGSISPDIGNYIYDIDSIVNLSAIPDTGYRFDKLVINGIEYFENNKSITITSNTNVTAYFVKTFEVNISKIGNGNVNPNVGNYTYDINSVVNLSAIPDTGYRFDKLVINDIEYFENNKSITITSNTNVTVYFVKTFEVDISKIGNGNVNPNVGKYTYDISSVVNLSVIPDVGYRFDKWVIDGIDNLNDNISINLTKNINAIAYFVKIYTLTISKVGEGSIVPSEGNYIYDDKSMINFKMSSNNGWQFNKLDVNEMDMSKIYPYVVNSNTSIYSDDYFAQQINLPKTIISKITFEYLEIHVLTGFLRVTIRDSVTKEVLFKCVDLDVSILSQDWGSFEFEMENDVEIEGSVLICIENYTGGNIVVSYLSGLPKQPGYTLHYFSYTNTWEFQNYNKRIPISFYKLIPETHITTDVIFPIFINSDIDLKVTFKPLFIGYIVERRTAVSDWEEIAKVNSEDINGVQHPTGLNIIQDKMKIKIYRDR